MNIKSKIKKLYHKILNKKVKYLIKGQVNSFEISVPFDHHLPIYQEKFKLYDKMLGKIANIIHGDIGGKCIDIGANIGDTALAILAESNMEVICIEGDKKFYQILLENTKNIPQITAIHAFVGIATHNTGMVLEKSFGTGKLVASDDGEVNMHSLESLLSSYNLADISLIKSDTDGFDFEILKSIENIIYTIKPSLFFEYDFFNPNDDKKALEVIKYLSSLGYNYIVYDNFGNFITCITAEHVTHFEYLNKYILSSQKYGGGIYYADIFATTHVSILEKVKNIIL